MGDMNLGFQLASTASLLWLVVNIGFAGGIWRDANTLLARGRVVWFAPPIIWTLATLVSGFFCVAAYWLIHHSSLAPGVHRYEDPPAAMHDDRLG